MRTAPPPPGEPLAGRLLRGQQRARKDQEIEFDIFEAVSGAYDHFTNGCCRTSLPAHHPARATFACLGDPLCTRKAFHAGDHIAGQRGGVDRGPLAAGAGQGLMGGRSGGKTRPRSQGDATLTPRQVRFVAEYLIHLNGQKAAECAGYAPKNARTTASQLLTKPNIQAAIAAGKAKQLAEANITAQEVLDTMARLTRVDVKSFYDAEGNPKPIQSWTPVQSAQVSRIETVTKKAEDGSTATAMKLSFWSKEKALDMLGKHFGVLTEQINVTIDADLSRRLRAGRERNAAATRDRDGTDPTATAFSDS